VALHHLAQLNIGRLHAPIDSPVIREFADALDPVNALAEASPGFVWRLQDDEGNATSFRPYEDDLVAINLTVWESVETLADFAYRTDHAAYLRRRREWFERMEDAYLVLWWVPAGHRPTIEEAVARLEHLREHGPTPTAFTFRHRFAPEDGAVVDADDRDACPA
jgi:hypothetical protein